MKLLVTVNLIVQELLVMPFPLQTSCHGSTLHVGLVWYMFVHI